MVEITCQEYGNPFVKVISTEVEVVVLVIISLVSKFLILIVYEVVFSDEFHSNFTASTSKHSVLLAGLLRTAFEGFCGVGGGSIGPPPPPSPSALPPH